MERSKHTKIIISRTDNIGDVILTLPLASLLKAHIQDCEVLFLARDYCRAIIETCPAVDRFVEWDDKTPQNLFVEQLRVLDADSIIHVFPKKAIATAAKKAKIPHRIGTMRRLYHLLTCNGFVYLERRHSNLHEGQLNLKLLKPFGLNTEMLTNNLVEHISLEPEGTLPATITPLLDQNRFNLIVHPGSNGNGREWPVEYFRNLVNALPQELFKIFITGTAKEGSQFSDTLIAQCPNAVDMTGKLNLDELLLFMRHCDGVVASSTGPMHMAAGVGIHTLGLFPPRHDCRPGRWGPIGRKAEYIQSQEQCVKPCTNSDCACMRANTVDAVVQRLMAWLPSSSDNTQG